MSEQSEPEFTYDLAVSFAGEQRDYVRAVVRGLGDELKVFFDEDQKATMLGENLLDFFTDLYQTKARYAAIFVSRAYAEKMWPNVERQSAMARAAQQRTAYILPIRMDDTTLPGLLPTTGYLDSRVEGLDGVISVLAEKLGGQRVSTTYAGRVPDSQADLDLLLATRPPYWEYWLYAGALRLGLAALESKYLDYEMGFAPQTGQTYFGRDAYDFLRTVPATASNLVKNFNSVFESDIQERAFGAPGTPGDPARILHLTDRFLYTYGRFLDLAAQIRGTALPDSYDDAQEAAARFGANIIEEIRQFVAKAVDELNRIPDLVASREEGEAPLQLELVLELNLDPVVSRQFLDGIKRGLEAD